jgi:hypothetical protein
MNKHIKDLAQKAGFVLWDENEYWKPKGAVIDWASEYDNELTHLVELIVRECIDKIETHRIPVGNSPAGELACEWTYDALKEIRDEIKEHFGVE